MQEEIKDFLPQYLSVSRQNALAEALKQFPGNIDCRMYSGSNGEGILQGDGVSSLPVIKVPECSKINKSCVIISNSCDISPDNKRRTPVHIVYAPIVNLGRYESKLREACDGHGVDEHIAAIKTQRVTSIFYLPKYGKMDEESFVWLDRICNWPVADIGIQNIERDRIFSLSMYGFYLFLLKLSFHFTRIQEGILRG